MCISKILWQNLLLTQLYVPDTFKNDFNWAKLPGANKINEEEASNVLYARQQHNNYAIALCECMMVKNHSGTHKYTTGSILPARTI